MNLSAKDRFAGNQKINYIYDAAGTKLQKTVYDYTLQSTPIKITSYAGNYIYEKESTTESLQFFSHTTCLRRQSDHRSDREEGINVEKNGTGFDYVYQYKDHLGNVRLSYADDNNDGDIDVTGNTLTTEIREENNYYPFGLKHKGYNNIIQNSNSAASKFKYNGVELEESLGLDLYEMEFRMYDPAIGRFNGIDPITHHSQGTSVAFDNNPIFWADPSGADAVHGDGWSHYTGEDAQNMFKDLVNGMSSQDSNSAEQSTEKRDPEDNQLIRMQASALGDNVNFTYELVNDEKNIHINDEKNIHKITLTGTTLNNRIQNKSGKTVNVIEIIIQANKSNPRIISSMLMEYEYNKVSHDGHSHLVKTTKSTTKDVQSALVEYVSNPLINELNSNPEYNPWNGNVNVLAEITGTVLGAGFTLANYGGVKAVPYTASAAQLLAAATTGIFLGNGYRNIIDHSGKKISSTYIEK